MNKKQIIDRLPQPSEIENRMKEKLEHKKINDEFGWTGEYRMSAKDVLDVIIDLQAQPPTSKPKHNIMNKKQIIEILQSHSYNIEDQAGNHLIVIDNGSWDDIATEIKNCFKSDVVGQSEQLSCGCLPTERTMITFTKEGDYCGGCGKLIPST